MVLENTRTGSCLFDRWGLEEYLGWISHFEKRTRMRFVGECLNFFGIRLLPLAEDFSFWFSRKWTGSSYSSRDLTEISGKDFLLLGRPAKSEVNSTQSEVWGWTAQQSVNSQGYAHSEIVVSFKLSDFYLLWGPRVISVKVFLVFSVLGTYSRVTDSAEVLLAVIQSVSCLW